MSRRFPPFLIALLLFTAFFAGMTAIQFATRDLPDNDGFYHIKLAYLMRTEGLKPSFPYLPLSILSADKFYDHHFLFHAALMPFTFGDLRLGAKWAAIFFSSLAFLSIWYLFYRQKVPLAWLWALGLLAISNAFLYRMSVTRAQSLSLMLLALAMLWLLEGKTWRLALLAFLYVWTYDAFPLLLAMGVLHFLAVAMTERRFDFRPLLFIGGGILAGLVINPYFPDNILFSIQHMLPKLADATSVRVGNEWYPYDTGQLLDNSLPALAAFASGILALGLSGRKMDARTAFGLLAALLFGLMLFEARRFVEYFPPFALIFAALAWSPLLSDLRPAPVPESDSASLGLPAFSLRAYWPAALIALTVILGVRLSLPAAQESMRGSKPYYLYAGASAWLAENTAEGERVFQTDWDDFPRLFYYNTHNTYLIGLDPTYMQLYDAEMYDLWVNITQGKLENPSGVILSTFETRYIHTDLKHGAFLRMAADDPGLREVYRDDQAVIFEVITP
ncbi:MAG: hypothetical protein HY869_24540 [Chloroflexi bacterium]|nr:hypothetical protein [Chloroflexota bacterium]